MVSAAAAGRRGAAGRLLALLAAASLLRLRAAGKERDPLRMAAAFREGVCGERGGRGSCAGF